MKQFAGIVVDITHESVDRLFEYRIPDSLLPDIREGSCVYVPFGKANKLIKGYVISISDTSEYPADKLKEIHSIVPKASGMEVDTIALAAFIKKRYGSTMIAALKTVIPVKQKVAAIIKKTIVRKCSEQEAYDYSELFDNKHQPAKARIMRELAEHESLPYELVIQKLHVSPPSLKSLESAGIITLLSDRTYRQTVKSRTEDGERKLSPSQQSIVDEVSNSVIEGKPVNALIHGITGAGKTEVYLGITRKLVEAGKQVIMLIPEIALTYQTVMRFYSRFGDRVSVVNSRMSQGERFDQYEKARQGLIDVMIGPRSALFTPFKNIGAIIIDEEHESSYKSENMPRYHAREVAFEIASRHGGCVVLGSATPSLESYYLAQKGSLKLYKLKERLTGGTLPEVSIVDLREEMKSGNKSIFSNLLKEKMMEKLLAGEQMMLFLNRRGIAGFVSCRACGHVIKCEHCDVSMSQHRNGLLMCHYCGATKPMVNVCPECGSKYIAGFKAGTQQVEDVIHKLIPQARVLRMDADTTKTKDSYDEILSRFSEGEADILVGTQMIVKGHDFPNVTLVGILAADLSLNASDYRAGERTFDLLTQAAGRAGRGEKKGEVIIQTYQPENYAITYAAKQDYEAFYDEEIAYREFMLYPPAAHLLCVRIQSSNDEEAKRIAEKCRDMMKSTCVRDKIISIGPSPAGISKVKDVFRYVLYYKCVEYDKLIQIKDVLENEEHSFPKGVLIDYDFDPLNT